MKIIRECAILLICLYAGELLANTTKTHFPPSLVGMLLLTFSLKCGLVKLEWMQNISELLLRYMGLFFVPPGVALMQHFDLIQAELLPIIIATIVSTVLVLVCTGWTYQKMRKIL